MQESLETEVEPGDITIQRLITDINECKVNRYKCKTYCNKPSINCEWYGKCKNNIGSYECGNCPTGFKLDENDRLVYLYLYHIMPLYHNNISAVVVMMILSIQLTML